MTTDGPPPAARLRPLAYDLSCAQCGYNLRGLDPAGRCPECNTLIADSSYADAFIGPLPWVRTVTGGTEQLCLIMVLYVPLIGATALFVAIMYMNILLIAWGLWVILQLWHVAALWQTAAPQVTDGPARASRRWWALFLAGLCAVLVIIIPLADIAPAWMPIELWGAGLLLVSALEAAAVLEVGRSLAERLGPHRIVWRGHWPAALYGFSLAALAVLLVASRLHHAAGAQFVLAPALCGAGVGALWRLAELGRLRAALQRFRSRGDFGVLRG